MVAHTLDTAAFRRAYSRSLLPGRLLLTGHSHQAWPDAAREAQLAYFDDAAQHVDDKWGRCILPRLDSVGRRILARMGYPETDALAFGKSTHELLLRLLSCFRWDASLRVVTTTGEFHSMHRQLSRLQQEGVQVTWVDAAERATVVDRLADALVPGTTLLMVSGVLFEDAYILPRLGELISRAVQRGVIPVVDAYHAFNVVPLELGPDGDKAFVTSGGYKYAQFGEGLCWLRIPPGSTLRPVYTGWFADFEAVERPRSHHVGYGEAGWRFTGATFDGSAAYRADAALKNFDAHSLDVAALRAVSAHQTAHLLNALEEHGVLARAPLVSSPDPARRGGFVTVRHPQAHALVARLRKRGVFVDARGELLRMGPAPYVLSEELTVAARTIHEEMAAL